MSSHKISKLTYFDIPGRGYAIRMALNYGGVKFEDDRVQFSNWPQLKASTPYGTLPTLVIEGQVYAQSNSLLRYVGKEVGLYPHDHLSSLKVDEIMDAVEDLGRAVPFGENLPERRKTFNETTYPDMLQRIEKRLEQFGSGPYINGEHLSIGDLKLFANLSWFLSGTLDGVDKTVPEKHQRVMALFNAVKNNPKINVNHK